jgi:lycopene cyclase domain-containing protein
MSYWLINVPFVLGALLVAASAFALRKAPAGKPWLVAAGVMFVLTAVFDNAIIGFGLVDYDNALISGIRLGFAPIEDFAYTAAALLAIPALWHVLDRGPKGQAE